MRNPNEAKTVSANSKGITISYTDSRKHCTLNYEDNGLQNLQIYGNVKYQKVHQITTVQNDIYRTAVYGLSAFTPEEVSKMDEKEVTRIIIKFKESQRVINSLKDEVCEKKLNNFMRTLFKKSKLVKDILDYKDPKKEYIVNKRQFKELGITKELITERLIEHGVLPKNFYEL